MKNKQKKRSRIVPAVVFATVITAGVLPVVAAGCDDKGMMQLTVACLQCNVAADLAAPVIFGVADLAFKD